MTDKLASEKVVLAAPMSFAGSAERAWRLTRTPAGSSIENKWARVAVRSLVYIGVVLLILLWWLACLVWYGTFGLLLVPYRLIRRGNRKRRMEGKRHRELLSAVERDKDA